jgi:hypothetical protein
VTARSITPQQFTLFFLPCKLLTEEPQTAVAIFHCAIFLPSQAPNYLLSGVKKVFARGAECGMMPPFCGGDSPFADNRSIDRFLAQTLGLFDFDTAGNSFDPFGLDSHS